ncbi:xanthine dehydrogenase/oxidase-like isoform X2 [Neocloeon triangulifer]|nr:xanthine dehydrogenase/oxidase-like isoform X2 [Neocloeon triangulifer]
MLQESTFTVNGATVTVGNEVSVTTSLTSYLRETLKLTGTKLNCDEGTCGACIVVAKIQRPGATVKEMVSINSCLVPVHSCHGWEITTIEGVGNRLGYHEVQTKLAQNNGTQCGFCTPGFVMNMFSLVSDDKKPTMQQVEDSFGSNICRCTGYRPILEAYKEMASDAPPPHLKKQCADIEDIFKTCTKTGKPCAGDCKKIEPQSIKINLGAESWRKVIKIEDLFAAFAEIGQEKYKLVAGNTGEGIYRSQNVTVYIDIKDIPELSQVITTPVFTVGANKTLTEAIRVLKGQAGANGYAYLTEIAKHWEDIASLPIRNIGTLAGNLALKKEHPDFPSDVFTILEAVGAQLNILTGVNTRVKLTLPGFLNYNMSKKVIESVEFASLDQTYTLRTFHVLPRSQSFVSHVNAAFLIKVTSATSWDLAEAPRLVFGGIGAQFIHASATELLLKGKNLLDAAVVTQAISTLKGEVVPDQVKPGTSTDYRKKLAVGLFYKFLLGLDPDKVNPLYRSGADIITRPLSTSTLDYETNESVYPLNQPIPKIEALSQCSGEIEYINDIPERPGELHAALVLTKQSTGTIESYDTAAASGVPGFIAFYSAADLGDIPNTFTPSSVYPQFLDDEEIFCSGSVKYAGQPVGVIVASNRAAAVQAAELIDIKYKNVTKPLLDVMEIVRMTKERIVVSGKDKESEQLLKSAHKVQGKFAIGNQYPLYMENLSCIVVPNEDGFDVYSSTQWMDLDQNVVSRTVGVPATKVKVHVKRIGGGFGGKQSRSAILAAACSFAAKKHNKAVRLILPFTTNIETTSKRFAQRNEYEVGFDNSGKIEYAIINIYQDSGCSRNESPMGIFNAFFTSCYSLEGYKIQPHEIITNKASNGPVRGPGPIEGIAFHDEIMERIAKTLKKDPLEVKLLNMQTMDSPLPGLITELQRKADYAKRKQEVDAFNQSNRWKKRGIAITPMKYPFFLWNHLTSTVSIYQGDGSVSIAHGGIEMGQGLNTKVTQVAAHILGLPIDQISIKESNTITGANNNISGGSIISEGVSYATMKACQILLDRLAPVKATMENPTWLQLIRKAYDTNVNLTAQFLFSRDVPDVKNYNIWGVCISEVEVDLLTGERMISRVDLLEDVGQSLSPLIDIGQIEGAFVMGLGYWLSEQMDFDPDSGRLLQNRLWHYVAPGAKDIPVDFRVYLRKNAPNPLGVLGSKTTGEPAICMSVNVWFAIRNALEAARKDAGGQDVYFDMDHPATNEHIFQASLTDPSQFRL